MGLYKNSFLAVAIGCALFAVGTASASSLRGLYGTVVQAMINEARKAARYSYNVYAVPEALQCTDNATARSPSKIAVCSDIPDLEILRSIIYHEMGHLVNGDLHRDDEDSAILGWLNDVSFATDLKTIKRYTELGKTAFDCSTDTGKLINHVLSTHEIFWNKPKRLLDYKLMIALRGIEQRADLFSLQKLWEQNQLVTILTVIEQYSKSDYIVARERSQHPSYFERALYIAGFLVDKGIDINALFKKFEEQGKCMPTTSDYVFDQSSYLYNTTLP